MISYLHNSVYYEILAPLHFLISGLDSYIESVTTFCLLAGAPIISDFIFSLTESPFTFTCVSSLSPPTEVIWEVDGERIYFNDSYSDYNLHQTLVNRTTSTYYNTLTVNGTIEDVIGEYSCTIVNSLGSSNTLNKTIKGTLTVCIAECLL